jgi:hypothetical protein
MQLAKLTSLFLLFFISFSVNTLTAQENSPFSRYGLGDVLNSGNVFHRSMGGTGIALQSNRYVHYANPASYGYIGTMLNKDKRYKTNLFTFDVNVEYNSRTLSQRVPLSKYNSRNLLFNGFQMAMQTNRKKRNQGLVIGLAPITRESYNINISRRIAGVDSSVTVFDGNGGAYQALVGYGYRTNKGLSIGFNSGYLFGKKDVNTNLRLLNDTVRYFESTYSTKTSFGNVFLQLGAQQRLKINKTSSLILGATYRLQNNLRGRQDVERITYDVDNSNPLTGNDSIFVQNDIKGKIVFPSTIGFGIAYESADSASGAGIVATLDFTTTQWANYRFYGQKDAFQNDWMLRGGFQFTPTIGASDKPRYWSNVEYRAGFYLGKDPLTALSNNSQIYAFTFGLGLPTGKIGRTTLPSWYPRSRINLGFEIGSRGKRSLNLKENFFRVAVGLSLADLWFAKARYQ